MRDLRDNPHSGYRAVHVWLRLPGGRVEVQIRTVGQSAWANTYERIGDLLGRGIRYNEMPEDQDAREIVELMHQLADTLARNERSKVKLVKTQAEMRIARESLQRMPVPKKVTRQYLETVALLEELEQRAQDMRDGQDAAQAEYLGTLTEVRRMLDGY